MEFYYRLENGTEHFICDPFSSSWETRCPLVTWKQQGYEDGDENGSFTTKYYNHRASTIVPTGVGPFDLAHGVVTSLASHLSPGVRYGVVVCDQHKLRAYDTNSVAMSYTASLICFSGGIA